MTLRSGKNLNEHPENANFETSSGVRRRPLTFDDVKAYTLVSLGFPVTEVEIETIQMGVLWEMVLDVYNKYLPLQKYDVLQNASSGINKYDLRALNQPYGRRVVDVMILERLEFFSPVSGVLSLGIPHPISHLSPDQYHLALMYIKTARKSYSSEPDWRWEEPILWLFAPQGFGGPFQAAYEYTQDASRPEDIPDFDVAWVKEMFLNLVKRSVGYSRGKFSGVPGPAGQSLMGESMVRDAEEKLEKLENEIQLKSYARTPPLGPGGKY